MSEEINNILELSKDDKNLHHKKGYGGLLFITLSMIQFGELKRYIKQLQEENEQLKRNCNIGNENLNFYREEYKKLEDNWNELKEYIEEHNRYYKKAGLEMMSNVLNGIDILNKMQELERGVSDVED